MSTKKSNSYSRKILSLRLIAAAGIIAGCVLISGDFKVQAALPARKTIEKVVSSNKKIKNYIDVKESRVVFEKADLEALDTVCWDDNYTKEDLRVMACIIFCEANSMSPEAKLGVANVIINRANDKGDWGHVNTVKEVIYDRKWGVQFSPTSGDSPAIEKAYDIFDNLDDYKGTWRYDSFMNCIQAAKDAFCGKKSIPDSYVYFNGYVESSKAKCIEKGKSYKIIDSHIYF